MKFSIVSTFLLILGSIFNLSAQVYENSQGFGLSASPKILRTTPNQGWFVVGESYPFPGPDSLYILVYDNQANLQLRKTLKVPQGERHYIHDAVVLPDGNYLIAFESTLCDVVGDQTILQKIAQDGSLIWEKISNWGETYALPHKLMVTPDGNVIGLRDNKFTKYDAQNGADLWTKDVSDQTESSYIFDCQLLPNSEDIILTVNSFLITLKKEGTPSNFNYIVENNLNFEPNYPAFIQQMGDWVVTYNPAFNFVARANSNGNIEILPVVADQIFDFKVVGDHIYWLGRMINGDNKIVKTDAAGLVLEEIKVNDKYLCGQKIAGNGNEIAVTGYDGYGPTSILDGEYNPQYLSTANWFRINKGNSETILTDSMDVKITDIKQNSEVDVELFGDPPNVFQNYSGGDFEVEITNNSLITLTEVYVNIRFGYNYFSAPCINRPGVQRFFSNLNLAPGASVWVTFGDVLAYGQEEAPNKFCFFTSIPNHVPDRKHGNDWKCFAANSGTKVPILENLSIYPNPVSDICTLNLKESQTNSIWQLFDCNGKLVKNGATNYNKKLEISVDLLPNAIYFLKINNSMGRIVVMR
jgi:outer membrane protein assembly factor BamB